MVSSYFASTVGLAALGQTGSQPAVPGAAGAGNTVATQGSPPASGPATTTGPATSNPLGGMLWILIVAMLLMVVMTSMGGRKQKKQREIMLAALKKNDRVLTTAGIMGTVVELYDHEVVLRVDEASNTRIRFARSAVQQILRESKDGARPDLELKPKPEIANAR